MLKCSIGNTFFKRTIDLFIEFSKKKKKILINYCLLKVVKYITRIKYKLQRYAQN